jgi:alpha-D-ribose 1-methylphosphonate 5-triphosphate synthase subunit PhnG
MHDDAAAPHQPHAARRTWMAVLARASATELAALLDRHAVMPRYTKLRGPEAGLVMVRGRTGGGGAPFNLGVMTVTRCTVRTERGQVGHAYIAGRDAQQAELAAVLDAMLQDPLHTFALQTHVIAPLADAQRARHSAIAAKAAATRVEFFAMRNMRT